MNSYDWLIEELCASYSFLLLFFLDKRLNRDLLISVLVCFLILRYELDWVFDVELHAIDLLVEPIKSFREVFVERHVRSLQCRYAQMLLLRRGGGLALDNFVKRRSRSITDLPDFSEHLLSLCIKCCQQTLILNQLLGTDKVRILFVFCLDFLLQL